MNRVSKLLRIARKVGTPIVQWQEIDIRNSFVEGADCFQSPPLCALAPSVTKFCKTANMTADIIRHASLSSFFNNARPAIDHCPFSLVLFILGLQITVMRRRLKSDQAHGRAQRRTVCTQWGRFSTMLLGRNELPCVH